MATENPDGWEPVGESERFYAIELPMSDEAKALYGGPRYVFYGEFDTVLEPDAWREYIYDPLRMLIAEDVPIRTGPGHGHLGINILKLDEVEGVEPDDEYVRVVTARGETTLRVLEERDPLDPSERERHVSTMVINHEIPLNPRIGATYA